MRALALMLFIAPLGMGQVRIYVANTGGATISVLDPAAGRTIAEVMVSPNPFALAPSPEGHWLYITSPMKNQLDAVDLKTNKRTRSVETRREPSDLAVAPDARHIFVCTAPSLDALDTDSLQRVKTIFEIKGPCRIYLTPDGTRMIVAPASEAILHVINVRSMETEFAIAAGSPVRALAIEGDRNHVIHRLFAARQNDVATIDYASRKISGRIPVAAHDLAVSPDWKALWATVGDSAEVFSLADLKRVATIPLGKGASGIVFTPDGKRCFVSNTRDNSVSSIDATTYREVMRIPVGEGPDRMIETEWMP